MAENEFWLLGTVVKLEVLAWLFEGKCWFIHISKVTNGSNITFAWKFVNKRAFLENSQTVGNSRSDIRMTRNLTELKQQLTDFLVCSSSCMEVLVIHGNFRNTGHLSGSNFGLVQNCRHLCLMVKVNISLCYLFFNKVILIKFSPLESFGM